MRASPPPTAVIATPKREREPMSTIDVDAHVDCGARIVGRRAQRLAEASARHDQSEQRRRQRARSRSDRLALVDEHADRCSWIAAAASRRWIDSGVGIVPVRSAPKQASAVLQDQRDAERQDHLRVVALGFQPVPRMPVTRLTEQRCMSDAERRRSPARRAALPTIRRRASTPKRRYGAEHRRPRRHAPYIPSIMNSPWAKLMTRMTPKIKPTPEAISP